MTKKKAAKQEFKDVLYVAGKGSYMQGSVFESLADALDTVDDGEQMSLGVYRFDEKKKYKRTSVVEEV